MQSAVQVRNLSKSFGTVKSNQHISLDIYKGEILSLLGENGSGKSTFVNMLAGIYAPEEGSISINGQVQKFSSPQDAIAAGVGMVHQHFKLVEVMTALENITLGENKAGFFINKQRIKDKVQNVIDQFGFEINLNQKIYEMSVSEKQTVEIVKILYQGARILILDEPTAVLTPQETKRLFKILNKMREEGCSVIIITHKLNEVMEISDRVAVLRKGVLSGIVNTKESSETELASLMIGEKVNLDYEFIQAPLTDKPILEVRNLNAVNKLEQPVLQDVSFDLYGGEMLGVAGIVGAGQKELCEVLTGMYAASGTATFHGENLLSMNPRDIKKLGIRMNFVPEDRLGMGLVAGLNVTDNVLLRTYDDNKGFLVNRKKGDENAEFLVNRFDIATPSIHHPVRQLSGGNIQKVLLAREIDQEPKFLIVSYPFRGLDVGATKNIIAVLNEQKKKGIGILLVAEDLDQLCGISDRVMVLHDGKNMGIVNPRETTQEQIGLMMMGGKNA